MKSKQVKSGFEAENERELSAAAAKQAELDRLKADNAELREALQAVIVKFEKEYQILTDGGYGSVEEWRAVKQARAALNRSI